MAGLIAHKDLPEDLAYRITKVVCENKDEMAIAHKAWLEFDPDQGGKIEKPAPPSTPAPNAISGKPVACKTARKQVDPRRTGAT